jgi:hypothetical protein
MSNRKKVPPATESDVLEKSGRRCCVCYALNREFNVKKGQVAHLDHNPANSSFENLCFLCQDHHDDYDSPHRQSKGLTLNEVKRYRDDLYKTLAEWKESREVLNGLSFNPQVPMLSYFENAPSIVKTTTQGAHIVERQAGFRTSDKKRNPSLNLDIQFEQVMSGIHDVRVLHLTIGMPFGLTMHADVCAFDNWSSTGFTNVLRNKLDVWILRGQPLQNDERHPIQQPRDSLFIYRASTGENRIIISTHSVSESQIQFHTRFSEKVAEGLAYYLEEIGFTQPIKDL